MFCLKRRRNMFGNEKNIVYCSWGPLKFAFVTQGKTKRTGAAFCGESAAFLFPHCSRSREQYFLKKKLV